MAQSHMVKDHNMTMILGCRTKPATQIYKRRVNNNSDHQNAAHTRARPPRSSIPHKPKVFAAAHAELVAEAVAVAVAAVPVLVLVPVSVLVVPMVVPVVVVVVPVGDEEGEDEDEDEDEDVTMVVVLSVTVAVDVQL